MALVSGQSLSFGECLASNERIAVTNDAAGSEFVTIFEFVTSCGELEHRPADLFGSHCGTDRRKEPKKKLLPDMRFIVGRPDIVRQRVEPI